MSLLSAVLIPNFAALNAPACLMEAGLHSVCEKMSQLRQARSLRHTNALFCGLFQKLEGKKAVLEFLFGVVVVVGGFPACYLASPKISQYRDVNL